MTTTARPQNLPLGISPELYRFDRYRALETVKQPNIEASQNHFEQLSVIELSKLVGEAEFTKNQQLIDEASDELLDRLIDVSEKSSLSVNGEHSQEALLGSVIEVIEERKKQLGADQPKSSPIEDTKKSEQATQIIKVAKGQDAAKKSAFQRFKDLEGPVKFDKTGKTSVQEVGDYNIKANLARLANPNLVAYDTDGTWKYSDIQRQETKRNKILLTAGAIAVAGLGVYLASRGYGDFGGADNVNDMQSELTTSKAPSASPEVISATPSPVDTSPEVAEWTSKVGNGEGVSQVIDGYFTSNEVNLNPSEMKEFIDGALSKGLLTPEHVSGLTPQEVYGGYGYPSSGMSSTFSPDFMDYANEFLKDKKSK